MSSSWICLVDHVFILDFQHELFKVIPIQPIPIADSALNLAGTEGHQL